LGWTDAGARVAVNSQLQSGQERRTTFPFFVGCPRSGTTLVRAIFNSHPDLAIPDETHFFSDMVSQQKRYTRNGEFTADLFLVDLLAHPWFPRLGVPPDDVRAEMLMEPPSSYSEAARRVFASYAKRQGKPRYGDKTPRNLDSLGILAETFPEARFIHIIRDGRNVALSLLDMPWGPEGIVEAARIWRSRVERGRKAGRSLGPSRYREVRYETLLDDPESTVRSVCRFIDLPFDPSMLRYFESVEPIISPNRSTRGSVALPLTKGLRDWPSQMSRWDLAKFGVIAGGLLRSLGYEEGSLPISARERLTAHLAVLVLEARARLRGIYRSARRVARAVRKRLIGQTKAPPRSKAKGTSDDDGYRNG